jgi:hypothetical protein
VTPGDDNLNSKEAKKLHKQAKNEVKRRLNKLTIHFLEEDGTFTCKAEKKVLIDPHFYDKPSTKIGSEVTCQKCEKTLFLRLFG